MAYNTIAGLDEFDSCPVCRVQFQRVVAVTDGIQMKIGDGSICSGCGALLIFDSVDPVTHRLATRQEREQFRNHPERRRAEDEVRKMKRLRGSHESFS